MLTFVQDDLFVDIEDECVRRLAEFVHLNGLFAVHGLRPAEPHHRAPAGCVDVREELLHPSRPGCHVSGSLDREFTTILGSVILLGSRSLKLDFLVKSPPFSITREKGL